MKKLILLFALSISLLSCTADSTTAKNTINPILPHANLYGTNKLSIDCDNFRISISIDNNEIGSNHYFTNYSQYITDRGNDNIKQVVNKNYTIKITNLSGGTINKTYYFIYIGANLIKKLEFDSFEGQDEIYKFTVKEEDLNR